ncbi:MAG: glycosyltransferase [Acidimicrobiales bacterium]
MVAVHQFVPALLPGDATGGHTLQLRRLLRDHGIASDIYTELIGEGLEGEAFKFNDYSRRHGPHDVLIYQMATASEVADYLYARPEVLVMNYHNVTPAAFFRPWDPRTASHQSWGRSQVARLSDRTTLAVVDSAYNEAELVDFGYGSSAVVPILLDTDAFPDDVDQARLEQLEQAKTKGGATWLFVGRVAPNKAQHDLIKALFVYRRLYDQRARLHLVGRPSAPSYSRALDAMVAELDLAGAVTFTGGVTQAELGAYYSSADVLVSASEHEGFCVPLLEAMSHRLPIVAHSAAAVPETVGRAGVLVPGPKSALALAAAVAQVTSDAALSARLVAAGTDRLKDFDLTRSRGLMMAALTPVLEQSG